MEMRKEILKLPLLVGRSHDCLSRKSQGVYIKTPRNNDWVHQGLRIEKKYVTSIVILYTCSEHVDPEIKNTMPFAMPKINEVFIYLT